MDRGAHFFKTDFQVHSPRDPNWEGQKPTSDEGRMDFAHRLVAACRDRSLDAIAITDHHDLCFFDFVRRAANLEQDDDGNLLPEDRRLIVFPGIELTLSIPCQALLLLNADFPPNKLPAVLTALSVEPAPVEVETAKQPDQLPFGLKALYERLDEHEWLRGQYIAFPNVTEGGYRTLMRSGLRQPYKEMPCVGGYIDGAKEIGTGNRRIFDGKDPNWGNKRIAVIRTSDSRQESFEKLGQHATWIKWAEPTAEALRQACLAKESRISDTRPQLPDIVLESLAVSNSKFLGPVNLEFNSQYSAIIGGRGTGKSTCLEYLRWALCDQRLPPDAEDPEAPDYVARRRRLIDQTLKPLDGQVEVAFRLNGTPHLVRRYSTTGDVMIRVGEGDLTPTTADDVQALLPVDAYSQRQLSTVGGNIEELRRFVTNPIRPELETFERSALAAAASVRENFARRRRLQELRRSQAQDVLRRESLSERVNVLRDGLQGLDDKDRQTLSEKPNFDRTIQLRDGLMMRLDRAKVAASEAEAALAAALEAVRLPTDAELGAEEEAEAFRTIVEDAIADASDQSRDLHQLLEDSLRKDGPGGAALDKLNSAIANFEARYQGAQERSTGEKSKLVELESLEAELEEFNRASGLVAAEVKDLEDADSRHESLRTAWRSALNGTAELVQGQCEALTELSGGRIRAELVPAASLGGFAERLKSVVTGSGIRGSKIDELIAAISTRAEPLASWHLLLDELEEIMLAVQNDVDFPQPAEPLASVGQSNLAKLAAHITQDEILDLTLLSPQTVPSFEYETKEGEFIAFADASAGQQATALLHVLLSQPGPPLIIDQPEDDLDSQVVSQVVSQIWTAKKRRQIIFTSHNANLVVNGDAELVACCSYRTLGDQSGGEIKLQGAIDVKAVRDEITAVMEGGELAFKLRKEKYGF